MQELSNNPDKIKVIRGTIICHNLAITFPAELFRRNNWGISRNEVARKLLEDLIGIEVIGEKSMQAIPAGEFVKVVWMDK